MVFLMLMNIRRNNVNEDDIMQKLIVVLFGLLFVVCLFSLLEILLIWVVIWFYVVLNFNLFVVGQVVLLCLWLYELKKDIVFGCVDYFVFIDNVQLIFGGDLVEQDEFFLCLGEEWCIECMFDEQICQFGFVVVYCDFDCVIWCQVFVVLG